MAFTPGNTNGAMNGTTPVDVAPVPGAATQREVRNVSFYNRDTAAVEITLKYDDNGTARFLQKETVQPGKTWLYSVLQVLDDVNDKLTAVMTAAPATTQPDFVCNWADKS